VGGQGVSIFKAARQLGERFCTPLRVHSQLDQDRRAEVLLDLRIFLSAGSEMCFLTEKSDIFDNIVFMVIRKLRNTRNVFKLLLTRVFAVCVCVCVCVGGGRLEIVNNIVDLQSLIPAR